MKKTKITDKNPIQTVSSSQPARNNQLIIWVCANHNEIRVADIFALAIGVDSVPNKTGTSTRKNSICTVGINESLVWQKVTGKGTLSSRNTAMVEAIESRSLALALASGSSSLSRLSSTQLAWSDSETLYIYNTLADYPQATWREKWWEESGDKNNKRMIVDSKAYGAATEYTDRENGKPF